MNVYKPITGKHLVTCFVALIAGFLLNPTETWSSPDEKKPDFDMVVQNSHSGWSVDSVSFSPDSKYFISGGFDTTIKLWNREGILLRTFEGHSGNVASVSFSPDGKHIVSGSWDKTIKLWALDGKLINTFTGHSLWVTSVLFSPDGEHIASGSLDGTIKLWDINGNLIRTLHGHSGSVNSVSFSPDGKYIVSGSSDTTMKLWNMDGKLIKTFSGHSDIVACVAFDPFGKYIISGSSDTTMKLWDMNGKLIRTFTGHSMRVESVSFSPDGKRLISGSWDKTIKLWNFDGKLIRTFTGHSGGVVGLAFSPDGEEIISSSYDNTIKLWSIGGNLIRDSNQYFKQVMSISFSPAGRHFVTGSADKTITLWSIEGKQLKTFEGQSGGIWSVSFSPDGEHIISGGLDSTVKLWNREGMLLRTFAGHNGLVSSVSFDPFGKYIISGSLDKTLKLWNLDGKLINTFVGHSDGLRCVLFNPDGQFIASGDDSGTIILWNRAGDRIRTFSGESGAIGSLSFSPDGRHIISVSVRGTVKMMDIEGKSVKILQGYSEGIKSVFYSLRFLSFTDLARSASFSPDGKYILSTSGDNTIRLWDLEGNLINTFKAFPDTIAVFSPDGEHIASGSGDGTIKLLNVKMGEYLSLIGEGNDWIMYTPDGYFDSSPHGGELVAMVKGMEAFGVDQFAARNNRPDLILERMGLGTPELISHYNTLYQKRLKKLGLTEADFSSELHAPEAQITGTQQDGKFIEVSFFLSDSKYPLKKLNIYVNDVPLFGSSGKEISGNSFKGTEKIELTAGKNKIEISAMNNTGAESFRALTYADYDGKEKGALYYLAFGASKYKDSNINLNYADKDIKDLEAVLSKMRPAYSDIHVKTFLNNEVTPENIKKAKDFLKDAKTDDTVILAIAGHGGYSKGRDPKYYYVAYETDVNKLASTGVDFDSIEDLLDDIKPRKKLFLMDTCESGELDENIYDNYFTLADARGFKPRTYRKPMKARGSGNKGRSYLYEKDRFIYNDLSRRTGAVVFSSSKGGEISYESTAIQNGFFTKEIINALTNKTADKNGDGKIDSGELRDFVSGAVSKATGGLQHPTIDRDNLYQKIELPLVSN